ncbi:MAG: PEP-CTERM sorting domain-containing protein [Luteolibacter sp.]
MKTTLALHSPLRFLIARCLLLGAASVLTSQAAVTINSTFNLDSGTNLYTYSYSVENTGPSDLALISIPTSPAANISGASAPTGFSVIFDSFQGFLSFVEDSDLFTDQTFAVGSIISPFQVTSALAPGTVTFTAFDIEGSEFTGSVVAPVPEPSSLLLVGLALLPVSARRRR